MGNTIIANNTKGGAITGDDYRYASGTLTDEGYNVVGYQYLAATSANDDKAFNSSTNILWNTKVNNSSTTLTSWSQNQTTISNTFSDLKLSSTLALNDGTNGTYTLALETGSFAIGAIAYSVGSNTWNNSSGITGGNFYDQRGIETPANNPISIGAYSDYTAPEIYYMAKTDGNWSNTAIWFTNATESTDPADFTTVATVEPDSYHEKIIVNANVAVNISVTVDELTINSGKTLTVNFSKTLTVADGTGDDLLATGNIVISPAATFLINSGAIVDSDGTFRSTGAVSFEDDGSSDDNGTLKLSEANPTFGTLTEANGTITYDGGNQTILALDYSSLSFTGSTSASTKTFADGITKIDNEIEVTESLTFTGSSAAAVTVQVTTPGEGGTASRVFNIDATGKTINISNMTVKGGDISGEGDNDDGYGGGISIVAGTLSLNAVIVSGSIAYEGGGIYNYEVATISSISGCTISGNEAKGEKGGGIYNRGTITTILNSAISDNTTHYNKFSGGICNLGLITTISSSTISGNTAFLGGGITNYGLITTISNSTISGNTAISGGGGIFNFMGGEITTLTNTTICGNTLSDAEGIGAGLLIVQATISNIKNCIIANNTDSDTKYDYCVSDGSFTTDGGYNVVEYSNVAANDADGFDAATNILYNTKYNTASTTETSWTQNASGVGQPKPQPFINPCR